MSDDLTIKGAISTAEANIQVVEGSSQRAILAVMDAHDELLCRAVLHAVQGGADEGQWLQVMRDTRSLLSSRFFDHLRHFEAQANADAGK